LAGSQLAYVFQLRFYLYQARLWQQLIMGIG